MKFLYLITLSFLINPIPSAFAQDSIELKIDPLMMISLKECRNITETIGDKFYPGWDFQKIPVLFYKPNIQELLINYPHKPAGFHEYKGFSPLGKDEIIYVRNDTTIFPIDGQNTSTEIEGISVLVVSDFYSRMRSQINGIVLSQTKEVVADWLQKWNFIESPYDEIRLILHEAFHVYQGKMAPEKYANENVVSKYPLLDPINNSLFVLEGNILRDALFSKDSSAKIEKVKEFAAVRTFRQSRLKKEFTEYENLNEYVEGTAKYVEYKFLKIGESVLPINEMYYRNGFNGYRGVLSKKLEDNINDMVKVASVSDNRLGNKYGAGPLRWRTYELGACQALLLDDLFPEWKTKIFEDSVYLCDLLKKAVNLTNAEQEEFLQKAKNDYNYDRVYQEKLTFEQEGKKQIEEKADAILKTYKTLVTISYKGYTDKIGISYTPFGVTQINENAAIYDMVPVSVIFKKDVILKFKKVVPVIIDKDKKEIIFAIDTPVSEFGTDIVNELNMDEFTLKNIKMDIEKKDNHVSIQLK
jgi:hypothetical protein